MALRSVESKLANRQSIQVVQGVSCGGSAVDPRRLLGAYYTPDALAGVLAKWALASGRGNFLDPSFGRCAFVNAATTILAGMGVAEPGNQVFGVDVDPTCMEYVREGCNLVEKNFVVGDFLGLSPNDVPGTPFHAVIGNPPYVRHHWFSGAPREAGRAAILDAGVALPATASAWAYFLIHSLSFLESNGRLTMLVPEAILQAHYAAVVRDLLVARFGQVCLVHIRDRLFHGTDEAVVVVAALEYGKHGSLRVEAIDRTEDLAMALESPQPGHHRSHSTTGNGRLVDRTTVQLLGELQQHPDIQRVSDLATVRIGLVTGANSHFIRDVQDLDQLGIPRNSWLYVVSRTRWLSGLDFTQKDIQDLIDAGQRAVLICPMPICEALPGIQRWIADGTKLGLHKRFKCSIRTPWFRITVPAIPDAFATCTRLGAPLLVLNRASCRCTNALHAIYWRCDVEASAQAISVGFMTSAVGLWAELHGRRYGGGVLKMEPGELKRTPVPVVHRAGGVFDELNELVRCGKERDARALADNFVLGDELGLTKREIRKLQQACTRLMLQRSPTRQEDRYD